MERLTGILFILCRRNKLKAQELASLFEVSERTIYRDVQALSELHVPVIAESGIEGGYSIAPEYFLQPLVFTPEECQAMFLGCEFIRNQKGFPLAQPAALAMEKLETIVPETESSKAKRMVSQISYRLPTAAASSRISTNLSILKSALENHQTVEIVYQALSSFQPSLREVDPYRLFFETDSWHILGFCHLRREVRQFKVARIKQLRLTGNTFQKENWGESSDTTLGAPIIVHVKNGTPIAQRLRESPAYQSFIRNETYDYLELSFPAHWFSTPYIIEIVLGFGKYAQIISPPEVRQAFAEELHSMIQTYYRV